MKILIITMGPGETSQGAALGKYLLNKGENVSFVLLLEENRHFVENFNCPLVVTNNGDEIKSMISHGNFDVVVLCNSKALKKDEKFRNEAPTNKPFVVSLDSNWLFNQPERYPVIAWLDRIYLNFPLDVYKNGLAENGGNYIIPEKIAQKIMPVGLIPSYRKPDESVLKQIRKELGLTDDQKFIFSYLGSGVTFQKTYYDKYIAVFDYIYKKHGEKIKVLCASSQELRKPWILPLVTKPNSEKFYNFLAAADLVFQHQGLGTLEQCISANVPVIANVSNPDPDEEVHAHAWEVTPFARAGLCKIHYYNDPVEDISKTIENLLENQDERAKIIQSQKDHYTSGEGEIYEDLLKGIDNIDARR